MEFLAHRGLWVNKDDRNTLSALFRGLDEGFGLETDIRDLDGQLVISHEMPALKSPIPLEKLLRYYSAGGFTSTLGINIKADGLQEVLFQQLKENNIKNYFVFDMSVPDTLGYLNLGMRTFIRRSDVEYNPELTLRGQGIWLDELLAPWIGKENLLEQASIVDALCIVSGELHGREYISQWTQIKKALNLGCPSEKLLICTDMPQKAKRFFNERY